MSQFIIEGGKTLSGEVSIRGSKNTALPLIAASLLTKDPVVLENVPDITDVSRMVAILRGLGAEVSWDASAHTLIIKAHSIGSNRPDEFLSRKLRGSVLFAGALLGRFRKAQIPYPGGDAIGSRPLTTHLKALAELGVSVDRGELILLDGQNLHPADLTLEEPSVTATENTIIAAVLAPGKTIIRLAAFEPHVQELVLFLNSMGADIRWRDLAQLEINGVSSLRGARFKINPDELEISSLAALAGATRSELTLGGIEPKYLDAVFLQLKNMGVMFETRENILKILKPTLNYKGLRIQSGLYPKLGSDHLPPLAVLATQAEGTSLIHDWLYEDRLRYLHELQKMGANCTILDAHRALLHGPTKLIGTDIQSLDIRAGMTLIIAALVAEGRSIISNVEHIDRGYERIDERLRSIGAEIKRINT